MQEQGLFNFFLASCVGYILGLVFDPEDKGSMFPRNIGERLLG